jgi:bifunctional UDP-N-acetylglucosamine pyrophosphorylase/glucosamine-1-phosphate N-acetyltransferase
VCLFKGNYDPQIIDKYSVYIDENVKIGRDVVIYPNNIIKGNSIIEEGVVLMPNNFIRDSVIKKASVIDFSYIEESVVGEKCKIGPFSRIRPNSSIGNDCKIGNFVEIKNSSIGDNSKASHLSYIGDADIGKNCNIGCGVVFANYNGKEKNRSIVGENCFIGSNVNVIAPINIANNSYICAGSTITKDTEPYDFVIARSKETIKKNYAKKYFKEG